MEQIGTERVFPRGSGLLRIALVRSLQQVKPKIIQRFPVNFLDYHLPPGSKYHLLILARRREAERRSHIPGNR